MVNYFIYAKDYSASTSSVSFYHENGLKTLKQFKSDVQKLNRESEDTESGIVYLHWGHECVKVDEQTTVKTYNDRYANGNNTCPETIVSWIKRNLNKDYTIKLFYIITDGLIHSRSMQECLKLNEDVHYENVVFHAFNRSLNNIDLSVAASFLKGHCTIYRNYEQLDDIDVSTEFDFSKITFDNFDVEKENLKSYIKLKYINTSSKNANALAVIDKLKELRNRLFTDLSNASAKKDTQETTDKNIFIKEFKASTWYKSLYNPSHDTKIIIEKSITTLINYIVSDKKSFAFDALKFETKFSNQVAEEPIVDLNFTTDQQIEFPDIILDDEKGIPVILCTELNLLDKLIFKNSDSSACFSKFNTMMECPLYLLSNPDLNDSIGYFYTLNVYKQLLEKTTRTEPRTRRVFHGGLVLVDTDDFDKYNDYILSATYFNFKKVKYNHGLFYYVLWKICEKKQWMDKNVLEKFKKYMLRRIITTKCRIGLSSLSLDPPMITSLPTALWYCVELSSYIFKDSPVYFTYERLRMYHDVAHAMIEILNYFNYDLDLDFIEKRRDVIRHVMILKKIQPDREKVLYLLERIFKTFDGLLVCEIENQANIKKLNYLKLDHRKMLKDDIISEEIDLNQYVHFLDDILNDEVHICDKTLRPYFMVDQETSFYSALYEKAKRVVVTHFEGEIVLKYDVMDKLDFSRTLSLYNLFLRYVKENNKFPSFEEYKEYVLKKKKFKDELVTIFPVNTAEGIKNVFRTYNNVIKDVSVDDVIKAFDKYVSRVERVKAENKGFENDNKIQEIILKEERKVHLVKTPHE